MTRAWWLALALATVAASPAAATTTTWSKSYAVGADAALEVRTDDGSVRVVPWSEPRIQIDVEAEGWKIGSGGLRLTESQSGDDVTFALDEPPLEFHFGLTHRWVRVTVHAPGKTALTLHTGDGNVSCEGIRGTIKIETGDGDISVSDLGGRLDLHTGDGHVEGSGLDGSLAASSGDGRIRLRGRFDDLDVIAHDGGVTVDVAPGSRMTTPWHVRSGDGPVTVRLPDDLQATLNASTGDGGITIDVPMTVVGRLHDNQLRADLHGGGQELRLRSGDGSIQIEPYSADEQSSSWNDSDSGHKKTHSIKHH